MRESAELDRVAVQTKRGRAHSLSERPIDAMPSAVSVPALKRLKLTHEMSLAKSHAHGQRIQRRSIVRQLPSGMEDSSAYETRPATHQIRPQGVHVRCLRAPTVHSICTVNAHI